MSTDGFGANGVPMAGTGVVDGNGILVPRRPENELIPLDGKPLTPATVVVGAKLGSVVDVMLVDGAWFCLPFSMTCSKFPVGGDRIIGVPII